jgi:hypothetical protein
MLMFFSGAIERGSDKFTHGEILYRAVAEVSLEVLLLGQDNNPEHYPKKDGHRGGYEYTPTKGDPAVRYLPVVGVSMSQLDSRNQELLCNGKAVLKGVMDKTYPQYSATVTDGGKFGDKPGEFFERPVFMGEWPS